MINQKTCRISIKKKRKALARATMLYLSEIITQAVQDSAEYQSAEHVGFYLPYNGEVITTDLIDDAMTCGKSCYLPTLHPDKHKHLAFLPFDKQTKLLENHFGIQEVPYQKEKVIAPQTMDCIFVPLVVFDRKCHRIGMGAGFYDRSFSYKLNEPDTKPFMIGLAYEFQHVENLEIQPWDVPLDMIVSEKKTRRPTK